MRVQRYSKDVQEIKGWQIYSIAIRITHNKKVKYIFTGHSAPDWEWKGPKISEQLSSVHKGLKPVA